MYHSEAHHREDFFFKNTPIPHVTQYQLTQFPLARYPEKLSSDSTNANFEINTPLVRKNPLLTDNLIGHPYWTALLDNLIS